MANALSKITTEAKKIRRAHPSMKWSQAIKQAGAKYRAGKIGSAPAAKVGKAKKRRRTVTVKKTVTRRVKVGSAIGAVSADVHLRAARDIVKTALGTALAKQYAASTKMEKRKIGKQIADLKKRYNRLK